MLYLLLSHRARNDIPHPQAKRQLGTKKWPGGCPSNKQVPRKGGRREAPIFIQDSEQEEEGKTTMI